MPSMQRARLNVTPRSGRWLWPVPLVVALLLALRPAHHGTEASGLLAAQPGQSAPSAEMSTQETQPAFTVHAERNLVLVRVVVRDAKGDVVTSLHSEDFRLLDNGKQQVISQFSLEGAGVKPPAKPEPSPAPQPSGAAPPAEAGAANPPNLRFVGLVYDDVHASFEDLVRTRDAAEHYLAASLQPGDRVGVYSSSGQAVQDFTDNREKLDQALSHLRPRPVVPREVHPCPDISPYQAHLMADQNDPDAIGAGTLSFVDCRCGGDISKCPNPDQAVLMEARKILAQDETQSEYSLRSLEALVRRLSVLPGQRSIVWISPGFLSENLLFRIEEVVDRALHTGVVINTLDSKGLAALVPGGDATSQGHFPGEIAPSPGPAPALNLPTGAIAAVRETQYDEMQFQLDSDVMSVFAMETGGFFFHNSNDYDGGFRRVAAAPGAYYVLGFSPRNLKFDGRFHKLKVELVSERGLALQARRGYFAPRVSPDAKVQAEEDIQQAVFSGDDVHELSM